MGCYYCSLQSLLSRISLILLGMQKEVPRKHMFLFASLLTSGRPHDKEQELSTFFRTLSHMQVTNPKGPMNRMNCKWVDCE